MELHSKRVLSVYNEVFISVIIRSNSMTHFLRNFLSARKQGNFAVIKLKYDDRLKLNEQKYVKYVAFEAMT